MGTSMTDNMKINLAACLHDSDGSATYLKALAAQYVSIRQRTKHPLRYFLIRDITVRSSDLTKLVSLIERVDEAEIINIEDHPTIEKLAFGQNSRYSPAVIWRVYYTDILPVSKVLSIDADIIALCDIAPLYQIDLHGRSLSAPLRKVGWDADYLQAIETQSEDYFRMTMCLMDLARMRKHKRFLCERDTFITNKLHSVNAIRCLPEQSVFNYFFSRDNQPMQCCLVRIDRRHKEVENDPYSPWYQDFRQLNNVILDLKGWRNKTAYSFYYWSALLNTPWHEEAKAVFKKLSV